MIETRHLWPAMLAASLLLMGQDDCDSETPDPAAADGAIGHPGFLSPHARPIAVVGGRVFATNTPADTVDVLDAATAAVVARIPVGISPVGLAVRPDGRELWVSNHVSDSVSVIDLDPASPTHLQVVATVQSIDPTTRQTRFDEPVGVAFASDAKAYVALSSENRVAVVDVAQRRVTGFLDIRSQDPRAIAVRGGRLYVAAFESGNQSQVSGCFSDASTDLCTFNITDNVIANNNVLSLGADVDVVKHPRNHDRDLYVFDTATDALLETVEGAGTLLYGMTVGSDGAVYIAQTDARNDVNGRASQGMGLAELGNRAFLNQITRIPCGGARCAAPQRMDLEPLPPQDPAPGMALATPYAVEISPDDRTLVATAAGSNVLFTLDAATGAVLGRAPVGAVPRGVALEAAEDGAPTRAWVLNAVADTVSLVDLADPAHPVVLSETALQDPTHPVVKRGRAAFNDANASTSRTFSCESCHPDGNTDQLVWVLDTPPCGVGDAPSYGSADAQAHGETLEAGCTQIPPRSTMPIRGLRDTAPYHWDGIPGDPYGGKNTESIYTNVAPTCDLDDPRSCTLDLVEGGLASTMCRVGACPTNEDGEPGALSRQEREDMATFLLSVPYPPAQRRAYDNVVSDRGMEGFELFHVIGREEADGGHDVCGNCHRMPFWVSTNTNKSGMDAPTWRGANDRWVILPQGRVNLIDIMGPLEIAARGFPEELVWQSSWYFDKSFSAVFDMVREGSTGVSGAFGRQVTLSQATAGDRGELDLLDALEDAGAQGAVKLTVEGALLDEGSATPLRLRYSEGLYVGAEDDALIYTHDDLVRQAAAGGFVGTFTGRSGPNVDVDHPQPALWTLSPIHRQSGKQEFPTLGSTNTLALSGRHVQPGALVVVDGRRVDAALGCQQGALPACDGEILEISLSVLPAPGMHLLQVQNEGGLVSNDFIFFVE